MIYLLTAIGLTPGGSSTVHIYTQTVHRTTQNKQYIEEHNNLWECINKHISERALHKHSLIEAQALLSNHKICLPEKVNTARQRSLHGKTLPNNAHHHAQHETIPDQLQSNQLHFQSYRDRACKTGCYRTQR